MELDERVWEGAVLLHAHARVIERDFTIAELNSLLAAHARLNGAQPAEREPHDYERDIVARLKTEEGESRGR